MQSEALTVHRGIHKELQVTAITHNIGSAATRTERRLCDRLYSTVIVETIFLHIEYCEGWEVENIDHYFTRFINLDIYS